MDLLENTKFNGKIHSLTDFYNKLNNFITLFYISLDSMKEYIAIFIWWAKYIIVIKKDYVREKTLIVMKYERIIFIWNKNKESRVSKEAFPVDYKLYNHIEDCLFVN